MSGVVSSLISDCRTVEKFSYTLLFADGRDIARRKAERPDL